MQQGLSAQVDIARANVLLVQLRGLFEQAVFKVAHQCAVQGKLDPQRLDEHQVVCYEIALAGAELLAAESYLSHLDPSNTLDRALGLLFVSDAMTVTLSRLESIYSEASLDLSPLHELASRPEWLVNRKNFTSSQALSLAGKAVLDADGDVDAVVLEGDAAMAQAAFRRFAAEVVAPLSENIHRQNLTVPEAILQPLREMGVFGLSIPEAYGGSAPSGTENALMMIAVTEALSEASLAAAGSLITRPEILARALLAGGTEQQKAHWLPQLAQGEPLCAISITEPDYGSDVAGLMLRASPCTDGWLLNGAKTWCTFAGKAGLLMVVARTDPDKSLGHKGLSLMLVEKPSDEEHEFVYQQPKGGRLTGRAIPTIGYRGMHSFDLKFEDFFVPHDCVIGGEKGLGQGFYFTMSGMVGGRMQTSARASGVMCAALKAAVRYAQDRQVFGAPLANFPLTQAKIARMAAQLAGCRQLTYAVGRMLETGGGRMEASLVKLFACRSAEVVTREALQIHGGMGYAEEMPVSRFFVDARVLSIFEGAEETLALKVVARSLLEQQLRSVHA